MPNVTIDNDALSCLEDIIFKRKFKSMQQFNWATVEEFIKKNERVRMDYLTDKDFFYKKYFDRLISQQDGIENALKTIIQNQISKPEPLGVFKEKYRSTRNGSTSAEVDKIWPTCFMNEDSLAAFSKKIALLHHLAEGNIIVNLDGVMLNLVTSLITVESGSLSIDQSQIHLEKLHILQKQPWIAKELFDSEKVQHFMHTCHTQPRLNIIQTTSPLTSASTQEKEMNFTELSEQIKHCLLLPAENFLTSYHSFHEGLSQATMNKAWLTYLMEETDSNTFLIALTYINTYHTERNMPDFNFATQLASRLITQTFAASNWVSSTRLCLYKLHTLKKIFAIHEQPDQTAILQQLINKFAAYLALSAGSSDFKKELEDFPLLPRPTSSNLTAAFGTRFTLINQEQKIKPFLKGIKKLSTFNFFTFDSFLQDAMQALIPTISNTSFADDPLLIIKLQWLIKSKPSLIKLLSPTLTHEPELQLDLIALAKQFGFVEECHQEKKTTPRSTFFRIIEHYATPPSSSPMQVSPIKNLEYT